MSRIKSLLVLSCLTLLLVPGCLRRQARYNYLKRFKPIEHAAHYSAVKEGVRLYVRAYSPEECIEVFNTDLISKGFQPLQLSLYNDSNETYVVHPSYIEPHCISPMKVAQLLKRSLWLNCGPASILAYLFFPIIIPFYIYPWGKKIHQKNKKIERYLVNGSLVDESSFTIHPWAKVHKFMFVRRDQFYPSFYVRVYNPERKQLLHYDVVLMEDTE